ncbi:hypothetical protein [Marinobacter salsuginis]|uniref:hypothetical protein n=1 Tax=Marinobacter salsuginis TaxID=418719 RepID=UPI00273F4CAA|nr:hypothetical protein [Marinobacter salsuginis]
MLLNVKAYIPLFKLLHGLYEDEESLAEALERRELFFEQLPSAIEMLNGNISSCTLIEERPPESVTSWLGYRSLLGSIRLYEYVTISAKVGVDTDKLKEINRVDSIESDFVEAIAATTLAEALEDALFFTELAFPGVVRTSEGLSVSGAASYPVKEKDALHANHNPDEDQPNWPLLVTLDLTRCISWAQKVGFKSSAFANCRLGRSLASLTHVVSFGSQRDGEKLFRSMQGLEAFYCDGVGDLRRQLSVKVGLWLGPWGSKRNIVGHLYDLRSKFVHGASNIDYNNYHGDAWAENEKMASETQYSSDFASRLLTATLQKCVAEEVSNINWEFSLRVEG